MINRRRRDSLRHLGASDSLPKDQNRESCDSESLTAAPNIDENLLARNGHVQVELST